MTIFKAFSRHPLSDLVEVGINYPCLTVEVQKESKVSSQVEGD